MVEDKRAGTALTTATAQACWELVATDAQGGLKRVTRAATHGTAVAGPHD